MARAARLDNGSNPLAKLLEHVQFVTEAQASKFLSPLSLSDKNVADVRVVSLIRHDTLF